MTVIVATAYIEEAEQFEYLLAMNAGELLAAAPCNKYSRKATAKHSKKAYIKSYCQRVMITSTLSIFHPSS